jgi:ribosomal protein L44E
LVSLLHGKVVTHQSVTDYDLIRPQVETELIENIQRRKRRLEEKALQQRRADIEKHYERLKSTKSEPSLPPLSTFRRLPTVSVIQSKSTPSASELQASPLLSQLVKDDLSKWREAAMETLGKCLGEGGWKSASRKKLHPVDRLTARFRCTKCEQVEVKYMADGCLDFEGACGHVCLGNKNKRKAWSADLFVRDDKVGIFE